VDHWNTKVIFPKKMLVKLTECMSIKFQLKMRTRKKAAKTTLVQKIRAFKVDEIDGRSRSYQTFFLRFFFFSVKLGHFTINNFLLYVTKTQVYQQKNGKILR